MKLPLLLRRTLRLLPGKNPGSALLPPIDDALAESDSKLRRQLSAGWPKEWSGPEVASEALDSDRDRLSRLYFACLAAERGDFDSYRAGLEQIADSSRHGAIQVAALRLLIQFLWVEVINSPPREACTSEESRRSRELLSILCDRVDRDYANSPWSDIILFFSESARGIVSFYDGDTIAAKLHLRRAEELQPEVERIGSFGIEDCVAFSSLARGEMAVEDRAPDMARTWLLAATKRLEGDAQAEAYGFLASSELDLGMLKEARISAERGMRIKRTSGSPRDGRDDSLEEALAAALLRLGEYERARKVLETIVRDGVIESKRRWAVDALTKLERAGR